MAPISTSALREPIVVVGSACRLAGGCNSPSKLWNLLQKPQDVRSEIPEDRFSLKGYYHPNGAQHGHMNVKTSYLLDEDPRLFDAEFFGINPVEASASKQFPGRFMTRSEAACTRAEILLFRHVV